MCVRAPLSESVTNATTDLIKDVALFVGDPGFQTLIIAKSVPSKKRIETDVQKLSTLEVQRQISFMSGKSMGLKRGDPSIYIVLINEIKML